MSGTDGCSATAETLFGVPGSALLRGNMAHRAVRILRLWTASLYSCTLSVLLMLVTLVAFNAANADNVFSASHTATASTFMARDVR